MTIYSFHALDKEGNTLATAEVDTVEAVKNGMLTLGYIYFPKVMKDTDKLVLKYPQALSDLREDDKFFEDIVLDVKSAKCTLHTLLRVVKEFGTIKVKLRDLKS